MGEGEMLLYFFDRILGDREGLNVPLPARPGGRQAPQGRDSASIWMRSRELVTEAHGFVFHKSILNPAGSPTGLIPFIYTYCHSSFVVVILQLQLRSPLPSLSLSLSLSTWGKRKGAFKGNLFKRMNKASTCYATSQEKNFADGFFAGFQLGAEKMGFSC
ncbi:hypothetical protein NC652_021093 [Populus alba x Populus x berolinensis]|nr:hypothetical protein NC652_021093 [Populus alba x Populus x berolinensis]